MNLALYKRNWTVWRVVEEEEEGVEEDHHLYNTVCVGICVIHKGLAIISIAPNVKYHQTMRLPNPNKSGSLTGRSPVMSSDSIMRWIMEYRLKLYQVCGNRKEIHNRIYSFLSSIVIFRKNQLIHYQIPTYTYIHILSYLFILFFSLFDPPIYSFLIYIHKYRSVFNKFDFFLSLENCQFLSH